jgi:acetyl esterase/lipase
LRLIRGETGYADHTSTVIFFGCFWRWQNVVCSKKDEASFLKVMNVRYATHTKSDPKLNMLNVYMPKKGSNSPMVVWVHGGSWAFGDKDNVLNKAEYFTARGYVFVSINYRLSPDVKHPLSMRRMLPMHWFGFMKMQDTTALILKRFL